MELLEKVREKWADLSRTKKSVILVGITCLVLSTYLFYRWATKVDYAPLFTNMQAESAGKIAENLKALNVTYKLGDAGKTILVPKDQVYELRLDLASKGVMSDSSYGFELFDKSDMGATDFERNVNYQRALQEELRRSIVQIDAVKQARVHLVIPEKSAFIENEHKPQASIVLELKPMVKLQPEQIKAIAELAAGSVENLKVEDVNIIDTSGNVLSDEMQNNGNTAQELNQMELKRNYEKDLEKRLQQFLDNIYGTNKAIAMVTADLDFNQKEINRTIWGKDGVIRSEQLIQNNTAASDNSTPVGEADRDPTVSSAAGQYNTGTDIESTKNYEIDKVEEKEIYAPGRVLSISTAVAINGELPGNAENRIKNIISAAIGFNAERGDTIRVLGTNFDQTDLDAAKAEMDNLDKQAKIDKWISWGLKGFGILTILILGLVLLRAVRSKWEESDIVLEQPASIRKVEEQLEQLQQQDSYSNDEEVKKVIKDKPEVAAQIITSWIDDNGSGLSG
jgi:flagellar M-ring protein FliF